jgi:hypothetical protein
MPISRRFTIRQCLVGAAMLLFGKLAHGQSPVTALTFEALPRAHKSDTARKTPPVRQAPPRRRDVIISLREQMEAQRDSIARLNRSLANAMFALVAATEAPPRDDSLSVIHISMDPIVLGPTPVSPASAPAPAKPAAPAPAAAAFAPTAVSGLLQIQLTGGDSALRTTYRVRRAEMKVVSDLGKRAQAILMVDLAKALALSTNGTNTSITQSTRVLQDAILSLPLKRVQIDAGQQRLPLGYEGSMGSSGLETVDRALMESDKGRGASFGDVRDLGVAAKGKWRWLEYRAGVFDGSGETMNDVDKNVGKAIVGQLAFRPTFIPGLRIGSSAATSGRKTDDKPKRDRVGADVVYARGRVLFQAEGMHGQDAATMRQGMYALTSVAVLRSVKLSARFDAWDPDVQKESAFADVTERDYLAGFTWLPAATRLKLQFAVVRKTYSSKITPAVTLALTQLQASW